MHNDLRGRIGGDDILSRILNTFKLAAVQNQLCFVEKYT